jgi:RNA polymerase sigma-70 factor (ECF subfamily)
MMAVMPEGGSLYERCRNGETSAYEELYRQEGGRMKSIACNLLGSQSDAEDAVQEAFMKIHRYIGGFREQARFTTWIYRVLVNTCYDLGRQRKRREHHEQGPIASLAADISMRVALENALAQLNERQRTVFLLAEVEGFDHAEIAGIMDTSEGNSRYLLWQSKRQLQQMLKR